MVDDFSLQNRTNGRVKTVEFHGYISSFGSAGHELDHFLRPRLSPNLISLDPNLKFHTQVMSSIIIGGCAMLTCVTELPETLGLNKTKHRQYFAILVGIPAALVVLCICFAAGVTAAEGWSLLKSFLLVVSSTCGLGNPLTSAVPASIVGKLLLGMYGIVAQSITGVVVGLVGGMDIFTEVVQ